MLKRFVWLALLPVCVSTAQDLVIKTTTELTIVNIAVRDKSGNIIPNLKKEDFIILEDDKPQTISVFEFQQLGGDTLPAISPAGELRTRVERVTPTESSAPAKPQTRDRRLIALFFDLTSMQPAEQVRAVDAAQKFLREQMTASDLVAVLSFTTRMTVVQDFTDDRDLLLATVKKFRIGESAELAVDADTGAASDDDSGQFVADDTEFNIFNTDRKLAALEDAAKTLARFPEKKALIYFSSGVSKTGVENQSQLRATVNAAVRANVAFYPIDARGLQASAPAGDATVASPRGSGVFSGQTQRAARTKFNDQQETLFSLAADTGGKALLDSNDLSVGITQAQKDINSYYTLGYYSTNGARDGHYRRIKVKLASLQNAKLDYRQGYYASKTFDKFTATDKERQLQEALDSGDPVSELPVALELDYFRLDKQRVFVPISVKIPGSAIGFTKKGGRTTADLDFLGQIRDAKGKLVTGVRDGVKVKLDDTAAATADRRAIQYDSGVTLTPGEYTLKFLARENQTGKMGSFETKFTVPDLGASTKNIKLSSVVWSNQRQALSAAVGSAQNDKKSIESHPLVQEGQKLVPSITRVFRKGQNLYVYFEVYDPSLDSDRKIPSVAADLAIFHGAQKTFESSPVRLTQLATKRPNVVPFQFQLPLTRFAPGQYTCQLNVIDEVGRKFAFPRTTMVIVP